MTRVLVLAGLFLFSALPAQAQKVEALQETIACRSSYDLEDAGAYMRVGDEAGVALYFGGVVPKCYSVKKGDILEGIDTSGSYSKVMLQIGSPRAIAYINSDHIADLDAPKTEPEREKALNDALLELVQKIRECWIIPPGAREANVTVKVRFHLDRDGSVRGQPEILNGPGDYMFATTSQSVVTAVLGCQNYDFLPSGQYEQWKELTLNFNPNMLATN